MAAASASGNGSLPPPSAVLTKDDFEAFDRFPWSKHRAFLLGLIETLGGADALSPNATHVGSATFCRTVFYRRQTSYRIDLTQYNTFLAGHPAYPSIDRRLLAALYKAKEIVDAASTDAPVPPAGQPSRRIVEVVAAGPVIDAFDGTPTPLLDSASNPDDPSIPSWQRSAPKNELKVAKDNSAAANAGDNGEAPYSDKFAKVIEAIQTGKELEGIRHIPDTVVRQAGITPMGKLKAPKKPWETAAGSVSTQLSGLSLVDVDFPPPATESDRAEGPGESSESTHADAAIGTPQDKEPSS